MGSFNTNCFASGQTIAPGNPVRIVPIRRQQAFTAAQALTRGAPVELRGATDSTCYADAFWRPMSLSLFGWYDDYGRVRLDDSAGNLRMLVLLLEEVLRTEVETLAGENRFHDVECRLGARLREHASQLLAELADGQALEFETRSPEVRAERAAQLLEGFSHLWEAAQEQRLFTVNAHGHPIPTQFAVVHQSAYDTLFALAERNTDWDGDSCERLTLARKALRKSADALKDAGSAPDEPQARLLHQVRTAQATLEALREVFAAVGPANGLRCLPETRGLERVLRAHAEGRLAEEGLVARILELVSDRYMMRGLEALNLRLSPMVYAGQDYDNSIGRAYLRFVRTVSQQVNRLCR